jgi:hypothetical protein
MSPNGGAESPPNFHRPSSFIDRTMRMHYIYIPSDRDPVPQALRTPLHPLSTTMRTSSHRFGWTASGMNNKIKQDQVRETLWPCKKRAPELPEELEGTRGSLVTNPHNMQDP